MRGSRGVGTGGLDYPLQHGKAQRCRSPQEHWFGTFGKAQSYEVGSSSDRWLKK